MAASRRRFQLSALFTPILNLIGSTDPPAPPPPAMPTPESATEPPAPAPTAAESAKTEDVVKPVEDPTLPRTLLSVYCTAEMAVLERKMGRLTSLPASQQEVLREYSTRLQSLAVCVNANGKFLHSLMKHGDMFLKGAFDDEEDRVQEVRELFQAIARDWSSVGGDLRGTIYKPLLEAVTHAYDEYSAVEEDVTRAKFRVLVPSAGTGRLCWELANVGFAVEGCEASPMYLATSNYMLNHATTEATQQIFPHAHDHANVRDAATMLRAATVPDVTARSLVESNVEFGMRVGSCVDVYADGSVDATFDAVVSCLVDEFDEHTALNVRTISEVLRPGGVWVFLGPKPQPRDDASLALTLSVPEFVSVVKRAGFKILSESEVSIPLSIGDSSMRCRTISAKLFTAMKVRPMK